MFKPWWQVALPMKNIREGEIDESIFAAKLGDVINNRGAIDYKDPIIFFKRTYLTKGLTNLLKTVCKKLNGKGGGSVVRIETPFGGGKTHTLIMLYHLFRNRDKLERNEDVWIELTKITEKIPVAKVAAIDGEELDAIRGREVEGLNIRTLWGEIVYQLGGKEAYEKIKEHDQKRVCPGKEVLMPILEKLQPFIILIDELVRYLDKTRALDIAEKTTLTDGTLNFLHHFSGIVSSLKKSVMIVSLQTSSIEAPEELLEKARRYIGRVETLETPVEGEEVYEIIRRRLFEDIGDTKEHEMIAQYLFEMYLSLGGDVPKRVKENKYRDKIVKAFPFHPETIDIFIEKWGSFPSFQRTRGALRLLALVVADLFERRDPSPLIMLSSINLTNSSIREELIKHIGNQFESVIALDIEKNSKEIDNELGSEYVKYRLASSVATSIFLHSFSGRVETIKKGISLPLIRVCTLIEKNLNPLITDVINRLVKKLWYLYFEHDFYWFSAQANINKILIDKKEIVKEPEIKEEILALIKRNVGRDLESCIWPEKPDEVPDMPKLTLIFAPLESPWSEESTKKYINNIIKNYSETFRKYKNTLIFLVPDKNIISQLKENIREFLGYQKIDEDLSLKRTLNEDQRKMLEEGIGESRKKMLSTLYECYGHVVIPSVEGIKHLHMGMLTHSLTEKISEKVKKFLKDSQELLSQIDPAFLVKNAFSHEALENGMSNLKELYENFLRWKKLPMIENENVLLNSVKNGVREGIFGLGIGDGKDFSKVYYGEEIKENMLVGEGFWVIKKEIIPDYLQVEEKIQREPTGFLPTSVTEVEKEGAVPSSKTFKKVKVEAELSWDKFYDFFQGVIIPLREDVEGKETNIKINIEVDAMSEKGIPEDTLDIRVEETLKQIKAKYKIEKE